MRVGPQHVLPESQAAVSGVMLRDLMVANSDQAPSQCPPFSQAAATAPCGQIHTREDPEVAKVAVKGLRVPLKGLRVPLKGLRTPLRAVIKLKVIAGIAKGLLQAVLCEPSGLGPQCLEAVKNTFHIDKKY